MFVSKKSLFSILAVAIVAVLVANPVKAADKAWSQADIEQVVHDYIMEHPEVILDAVQNYQETAEKEKRDQAVKTYQKDLFEDPETPVLGNPNGDVTLIEFFDYNCGYCKKVLPVIQKLAEEDPNLRILFKDFAILGPMSETAAKWAIAANYQGKYFEFHQKLMQNRKPIKEVLLEDIASDIGLDVKRLKKDAESSDTLVRLEKIRSLALNMDIRGTPAFVIGDQVLSGALDISMMKRAIADQRARQKDLTESNE